MMNNQERNAAAINRLRTECLLLQGIVRNFDSTMLSLVEELRTLKETPSFSKFVCQTICDRVDNFECPIEVNFEISRYIHKKVDVDCQYIFHVIFTMKDEREIQICQGELRYSF